MALIGFELVVDTVPTCIGVGAGTNASPDDTRVVFELLLPVCTSHDDCASAANESFLDETQKRQTRTVRRSDVGVIGLM